MWLQSVNVEAKYRGAVMQFAYRELLKPVMGGLAAAISLCLLVHYTVLDPLGTARQMGWMQRVGFSALVGTLQFPVCYAASVLTLYIMRYRRPFEVVLALAVMVLILAASSTAIGFTVLGIFLNGRAPGVSLQEMYGHAAFNLLCGTVLVFYVLWFRLDAAERYAGEDGAAVAEAPSGADGLVSRATLQRQPGGTERRPDVPAAGARFFDRLPDELGRDVIYLSASAHYVDVITATGSTSILLRFSDAVSELGDLGIRVHRSYWVAFRHVRGAARRDGRTVLLLSTNHEVRVGRNYLPDVRAAVPMVSLRTKWNRPAPGSRAGHQPRLPGHS